ncbi:hypothetical protein AAEX28_04575 [Lentisphaerota bacterium WC36G]|nr:hypothetical protein LJT99_07435 [Lentisphaerae bacterium WC36]
MNLKKIAKNCFLTVCVLFFIACSFITFFTLTAENERTKIAREFTECKNLQYDVITIKNEEYLKISTEAPQGFDLKNHQLVLGFNKNSQLEITWEKINNSAGNLIKQNFVLIPSKYIYQNKLEVLSNGNKKFEIDLIKLK